MTPSTNNAAFWDALVRGLTPEPTPKEEKQVGWLVFLLVILALLLAGCPSPDKVVWEMPPYNPPEHQEFIPPQSVADPDCRRAFWIQDDLQEGCFVCPEGYKRRASGGYLPRPREEVCRDGAGRWKTNCTSWTRAPHSPGQPGRWAELWCDWPTEDEWCFDQAREAGIRIKAGGRCPPRSIDLED